MPFGTTVFLFPQSRIVPRVGQERFNKGAHLSGERTVGSQAH